MSKHMELDSDCLTGNMIYWNWYATNSINATMFPQLPNWPNLTDVDLNSNLQLQQPEILKLEFEPQLATLLHTDCMIHVFFRRFKRLVKTYMIHHQSLPQKAKQLIFVKIQLISLNTNSVTPWPVARPASNKCTGDQVTFHYHIYSYLQFPGFTHCLFLGSYLIESDSKYIGQRFWAAIRQPSWSGDMVSPGRGSECQS